MEHTVIGTPEEGNQNKKQNSKNSMSKNFPEINI